MSEIAQKAYERTHSRDEWMHRYSVIVGIIACLLFIMMCGVILAQVFGGGGDEM